MRVREDHGVERLASPRPEDGREDTRAGVYRASDEAPAVDEERAALGQIDERGVALPDVEDCHAQEAMRRALAHREDLEREEACQRDRDGVGLETPGEGPRGCGDREDRELPWRGRGDAPGEPRD